MYAIQHRQHQKTGQWFWRVSFRRAGQQYTRTFFEAAYGGQEASLRLAVAWRDQKLAEVEALSVVAFCALKRENNTSGVPGVHFLRNPKQPEGAWQAKLKIKGRAVCKSFSVRLYGYDKAFQLAVKARKRMLASAEDRPYLHDATAKRVASRQARPPNTGSFLP